MLDRAASHNTRNVVSFRATRTNSTNDREIPAVRLGGVSLTFDRVSCRSRPSTYCRYWLTSHASGVHFCGSPVFARPEV